MSGPATRPGEAGDAAAIARVLTDALSDKYRPAFGRRAERALAALVRDDLGRRPAGYWVAEIDGAVVGAVHLDTGEHPPAGVERLARELGWPRAIWATAVLAALAHERLARDEAYVDELGVAAAARRRGVARALLAACATEARHRGRRRLTLWVTADNAAGLRLYEGDGFRAVRRRRLLAGRLVFGSPAALFMEKSLD